MSIKDHVDGIPMVLTVVLLYLAAWFLGRP
jgi:hypothetical protein